MELAEIMINKDVKKEWGAGQQLEALRYYLPPEVDIVYSFQEGNYQGECFAVMKYENKYYLWRDSFGSCNGCDSLEGEDGYGYIYQTLQNGNTIKVEAPYRAKRWLKETTDPNWEKGKFILWNFFNVAKIYSQEQWKEIKGERR